MMNYQYPASYMLENPDQLLKIGPTPPPILPSLDQNEIEQTLYERRVSQEAAADSLQPLQINYQTQYYQPPNTHYSPPAQQRSAPVQNPQIIGGSQSAVLYSKTPQIPLTTQNKVSNVSKPLTPATPPPPHPAVDNKVIGVSSSSSSVSANSHSHHSKPTLSAHGHSHNDIVAITPQSHANHLNSNSASNHSTASNNTTTTTVIESASHSSHSSHSPHSPKQMMAINNKPIQQTVHKQHVASISKIPAPQLAHPLPANNQQKINGVTEGIVIPMDQQNYTAFLSQMYGNQVPAVNGHYAPATTQDVNAQYGAATYSRNAYQPSTIQDIYASYDSNPYTALYNTPPLPSNHGYYTNPTTTTTAATSNYYQHQPHTAPSHVLSPPHGHYSSISKPADIYNQPTNTYTHQHQCSHHHYSQQPQTQQVSTTNYYHTTTHHQPQQQQSPHSSHHLSQQSPKTMSNTSPHSHHSRSNKSHQLTEDMATDTLPAEFLHRCDGTIISPHSNPVIVQQLVINNGKGDELDAFTAGDDALFGTNMVTIISVNWTTNIPYATVRIHISNRIHHVPLMDLTHISGDHKIGGKKGKISQQNGGNNNNNRYRLGMNATNGLKQLAQAAQQQNGVINGVGVNVNGTKVGEEPGAVDIDIGGTVIRRNPKLSDETLMKLPHLRKHREYIRTIDVNMGPKDYNSYRVSVNSKGGNNNSDGDDHSDNANNGRTANIQNLNAKQPSTTGNNNNNNNGNNRGNLNANNNGGRKKNKRMSACEKGDLFKTELCENWVKKGHCTYGKKCHFAHGREDIRTRWRIENYKTQPCCDPARADSRLCLFGKRCNYAHPGEPLRRSHHCQYLDEEYQAEILKDYGATTPYPFGIYI